MTCQTDGDSEIQRNPWLSVIIPIYNAEKYLGPCLDSILSQSFSDFELLLVDDGSTDGSLALCHRYAQRDDRIRVFTKPNGGGLHTRVYGAQRARGTYLFFCDSDDSLMPGAFSTLYVRAKTGDYDLIQFQYYKKYRHLKRKIANVTEVREAGAEEFKYRHYPILLCSFYDASKLHIVVWSKLYHRRLLQNLPAAGIQERVFMGDDLILNLYALQHCRSALFLPDALYVYYANRGGTSRFREGVMRDVDCIKRYQLAFLEQWDGPDRDRVLGTLYSEIAGWFFVFVQQCLSHLEEARTVERIQEALAQPTFVQAAAYYRQNPPVNRPAAALLAQGDPAAYLQAAREAVRKQPLRARVRKALANLLYRL